MIMFILHLLCKLFVIHKLIYKLYCKCLFNENVLKLVRFIKAWLFSNFRNIVVKYLEFKSFLIEYSFNK